MGTLVHWYNGTMVHWYIGTMVHGYIGIMVHWYIRTFVQWYIGKESRVEAFEHTSICGGVVGSRIKKIETWLV